MCVLWDWGSLWGCWCCFELSSAGCVNTSQWIDGGPGRGFRFLQIHNTPSVLRSHYYAGCPLLISGQVHNFIIWRIVPCFDTNREARMEKKSLWKVEYIISTVQLYEWNCEWEDKGVEGLRRGRKLCIRGGGDHGGQEEGNEEWHNHTQQLECMRVSLDLIRAAANAQPTVFFPDWLSVTQLSLCLNLSVLVS